MAVCPWSIVWGVIVGAFTARVDGLPANSRAMALGVACAWGLIVDNGCENENAFPLKECRAKAAPVMTIDMATKASNKSVLLFFSI